MSQETNAAAEEALIPSPSSEELVRAHAKKIIEALLFSSNAPLPLQRIREILLNLHSFKPKEVIDLIHELKQDYQKEERPLQIEEIAEGYLIRTTEAYSQYVEQLYRDKKGERLSQAAREVLSIVAFKQPVTKPQIEAIRGVDSAATVQLLVEKELIEPAGQAQAPGRPTLYAVSNRFLRHFGLKSVDELVMGSDPEKLELN